MKVESLNIIKIDNGMCFMCGESFTPKGDKQKTEHHVIPQCLKPIFNITVPLHKCCHEKLNALYAVSQPTPKAVGITVLKRALNDIQGLKGTNLAFGAKIDKVESKIQKEIDDRVVKPGVEKNEESI